MAIRTLGQSLAPALYLFHTDTALGWRIMHRITFRRGEAKVARGVMRRVIDEAGNHIGYQPLAVTAVHGDRDIPSQHSAASISLQEMKVNAEGVSRTVGLPALQRDERVAAGRAPEDRVERVQRKVQVYPHIGAAKGDILRVWPRNAAEPLAAGV